MDTYIADKGIKFGQIPDSYVIFISKKDFFGQGKAIYHIDRVLRETGDVEDNGFYEIYVNTHHFTSFYRKKCRMRHLGV